MKEHLILGTNLAPRDGYSVIYGLNDVPIGICSDSTYKDLISVCTKLPIGSLLKVFNKEFKVSKDFIQSLTVAVKGVGMHANISMILIDAITLLDKAVPLTKENIEILLNTYYDIFDSAYFRLLEINGNAKMFDNTKQSIRFQNAFHTRSRSFDNGEDDYSVNFSLDLDTPLNTVSLDDDDDYANLSEDTSETPIATDSPFASEPILSEEEEEAVTELPDLDIDLSSDNFNRTNESASLEEEESLNLSDDLIEEEDLIEESTSDEFNVTEESQLEEPESTLLSEDDSVISMDKDLEDDYAFTNEESIDNPIFDLEMDFMKDVLSDDYLTEEQAEAIVVGDDIILEPVADIGLGEEQVTDELLFAEPVITLEEEPIRDTELEEEPIRDTELEEEPVRAVELEEEEPVLSIELEEEPIHETELEEEEPAVSEPIYAPLSVEEVDSLTGEETPSDISELKSIDISNPKIDVEIDLGERNISVGYVPLSSEVAKTISIDDRFTNIPGYDNDLMSFLEEDEKVEPVINSEEEVAVTEEEAIIVLEEADEPIVLTELEEETIHEVNTVTVPLAGMPTSEAFQVETKEMKHKDISNIPESDFKADAEDVALPTIVATMVTAEMEKLKKNVLIDVAQLTRVIDDVTKRLQRMENNTLISPINHSTQVTQSAKTVSRELSSYMPIFEEDGYEPLRDSSTPKRTKAIVKTLSEIDSEVGYVYKAVASPTNEANSNSTSNSDDLSDKGFDAINEERRSILKSVLKSRGEM